MGKEFHEAANIFPMMAVEEFAALKQDIAENGMREAIWLHPDGRIIDGRNRYRACEELGIAPVYRTWDGRGSLVSFVVSLNLHRRHLTSGQRAAVAVEMLPMLEAEAKERMLATLKQNAPLVKELTNGNGKAATQAAAATGTNREYVAQAKALKENAPDLFEKVRSGESSITQARREHVRRTAPEAPPMPSNTFRVIYADPPWSYGNTMPDGTTSPADYYASLSTPAICELPVRELADDNAVLFLWTTSPHLEESFDVIRAWGFKYKTSFVWDKVKHNMGHYNSVRHELLLVCVRGSCQPDVPRLFDSVQSIERTEHSVKPEEFRTIIDTIYPHGRRVELFARRPVDGWERWGNEAA